MFNEKIAKSAEKRKRGCRSNSNRLYSAKELYKVYTGNGFGGFLDHKIGWYPQIESSNAFTPIRCAFKSITIDLNTNCENKQKGLISLCRVVFCRALLLIPCRNYQRIPKMLSFQRRLSM